MPNKFTEQPWDGDTARFDIEELKKSVPKSVLDLAMKKAKEEEREVVKEDLKLPYREPSGEINVGALRAILAVLGGARGGVDLPQDVKDSAKEEISSLLEEFKEEKGEKEEKKLDGEEEMPKMPESKEEELKKEFASMKDVEIFRTGTWNGDIYEKEDLQDMVNNFNKLKHKLRPRLKLGHNNKQELLKEDGLPSAGYVTNLYMKDDVLFADFDNIPDKVFELIKSKLYNDVSVEIHWGLKDENTKEKFDRVLSAVALLGEEHPAVWDNPTLDNFLPLEAKAASKDECTLHVYAYSEKIKGEEEMKKYEDELNELKLQNEKLKQELVQKNHEASETKVNQKLNTLLQTGKIIPAQVEYLKHLMLEQEFSSKEYSLNLKDKEEKIKGTDLLEKFINLGSSIVSLNESSKMGKTDNVDNFSKAKEYSKEHGCSFEEALKIIDRQKQ